MKSEIPWEIDSGVPAHCCGELWVKPQGEALVSTINPSFIPNPNSEQGHDQGKNM